MAYDLLAFSFFNALAGRADAIDWTIIFFAEALPYIAITLIGIALFLARARPWKERAYAFLLALATAAFARFAITGMLWRLYERPRPFLSHDVNQLLFVDAPSFPSGHSTFMFAFSTVIWFYDRRLGAAMFVATIAIVLSRIAASVHYPSDILGGAVIGSLAGYAAYRALGPRTR